MIIKELYELDFNCDGCSTSIKVTEKAFNQVKDGFAFHHEIFTSDGDDMPFDESDDVPQMLETHWYYKLSDGQLVHFGHTVQAIVYRCDCDFKEDLD